jgi:cyanate lyase
MKREDLTEKLLDIKREKGWTWKYIQDEIGGISPILITAACMGQMKLPKAQAAKAAELFGLSQAEERMLNEAPYRGSIPQMPPTDPLIYRFYELVMVYGTTAIDFNMTMEREPNNKGDRVKMNLSGKFLPYKYYGNEDGVPEYGFKEP